MAAKPITIVQISDHSALGDFVYRVHEPAAALGQLGPAEVYDVHYLSRYRDEAALAADILIIYLVIDIELFRLIEQRRQLGKPTFCEINDYFFDIHPWNKAYKSWSNPQNQKVFTSLMARSDAVQVSSKALAQRFAQYNPRIGIFANHIAQLPGPRSARRGHEMVVGWGGSAGHLKDISSAAPLLMRWLAAHPEARLAIMGPPSFEKFFKDASPDRFRFEIAGSLEHYCKFVRTLDVGIAPLLPTEYNRCRSDVKFLEYAAHGVVGVMQRMEPYVETIKHGENGMLFSNETELTAALDRLASAPALRERLAQTAYDYVRRERLLHQHAQERLKFYREHAEQVRPSKTAAPEALKTLAGLQLRTLPGLESAGPHYWRLAAKSPAELKFTEGMTANGMEKFQDAIAAFTEATRLAPEFYQAHYFLGRTLLRLGRIAEAERAYSTAARLQPFFSRAWRGLSELHKTLSDVYARKLNELNPPLT